MVPGPLILLLQFIILLLTSIVVMVSVYRARHKILWHFPLVASIGTLFIDNAFLVWIVILIFLLVCWSVFKKYLVNDNVSKSLLIGAGIGIVTFAFGVSIFGVDRTIGNASYFSIWYLLWLLITIVLKEEIIFRVYLFVYIMERGVSFRIANLVQATLFTTLHFYRYLTVHYWPYLIVLFISSLTVGWVIHRYKNYTCGFSEHLVVNGGSLLLYILSTLF